MIIANIKQLIKTIMIKIAEDPKAEVSHNDTYDALMSMIKWTRQFNHKKEVETLLKSTASPLMWAKEFCTIKFCLPRQSGHTTFIKKMLDLGKMSGGQHSLFESPIVIFPNIDIAENSDFSSKWDWVGTPKNLDKFYGTKCDGIIVDCASIISKNDTDLIYNMFNHNISDPNFVFIFLE